MKTIDSFILVSKLSKKLLKRKNSNCKLVSHTLIPVVMASESEDASAPPVFHSTLYIFLNEHQSYALVENNHENIPKLLKCRMCKYEYIFYC